MKQLNKMINKDNLEKKLMIEFNKALKDEKFKEFIDLL